MLTTSTSYRQLVCFSGVIFTDHDWQNGASGVSMVGTDITATLSVYVYLGFVVECSPIVGSYL